jgi:hypothetical protein
MAVIIKTQRGKDGSGGKWFLVEERWFVVTCVPSVETACEVIGKIIAGTGFKIVLALDGVEIISGA